MHKKKLARCLAASFSIIACVVATLFGDLIAYANLLFNPRMLLDYVQVNYAREVLLGAGGNFAIAMVLSAMLFFFARKDLISEKFHKKIFIAVSIMNVAPRIHLLVEVLLGGFNPSIYTLSFEAILLAYMLPVICGYILVQKKYPNKAEDSLLP